MYAQVDDPGPPGPPPRPGLVWKAETQRWVRPDGIEAGGASTQGSYTSPPAELRLVTGTGDVAGDPGAPARGPVMPEKKLEVSPGLTPDELEMERASQEYAFKNYPTIRAAYLAKPDNAARDDKGNLTSITLNTDEWREFLPGYTGTNAQVVHEGASWLNKSLYAEALVEMRGKGNGKMMVLAGGGGSGKGTALKGRVRKEDYPLILDQVSDNLPKLEAKLDEAKRAGFAPDFIFIDREPEKAWGGVVGRAINLGKKGLPARTVRVDAAPRANVEARKTALALLEKRPDIPVTVFDNRDGYDRQMITDRAKAAEFLRQQIAAAGDPAELVERMARQTVEKARAGEIPEPIAAGLLGPKRWAAAKASPMGEGLALAARRATAALARFREVRRRARV